jgi:hypothetical protein
MDFHFSFRRIYMPYIETLRKVFVMQIKKKLNSVVNHVKSHPAMYAYAAGVIVAGTATFLSFNHELNKLRLVDLDKALARIKETGTPGFYYPMDDTTTLLLIVAPDTFQP